MLIRTPFTAPSRLRFIADPPDGGENDPDPTTDQDPKNENGFPVNTPVKDMTAEQQAAYHSFHSRKHEDRVKAYGEMTPDRVKQLQKDYDELKKKGQSDTDKAIDEALERGRAEVRGELALERVNNALTRELNGRVPDALALLELNRSDFVKDGSADTESIKRWVLENSTEASKTARSKDPGQGKRDATAGAGSVSAGRDLFADRHPKK